MIAVKDLRLRARDRSVFIFAFVAPLALATIISFAFRGQGFESTFAIADLDRSDISRSFVEGIGLALEDAVTFKTAESEDQARTWTEDDTVNAAIVIPSGFARAIQNAESIELRVFRNVDSPISGAVATAVAEGFANELNAGRLSVATALAAAQQSGTQPNLQQLIERATQERIPVALQEGGFGARELTSASYYGPAMAIFFLSFTVQFGVVGLLTERKEGTLRRMLASPTRPAQVIVGKSLGAFVIGITSLVLMNLATSYLLGANWGPWLGVIALGSATIFAFMGIAAIGTTIAKTQEAASGFVSIVMSLFALLGGNFIPLSEAPQALRTISLGTPNGWAIRGFIDLTTGAGLDAIVGPVIALLGIGTVATLIALTRGRRLMAV